MSGIFDTVVNLLHGGGSSMQMRPTTQGSAWPSQPQQTHGWLARQLGAKPGDLSEEELLATLTQGSPNGPGRQMANQFANSAQGVDMSDPNRMLSAMQQLQQMVPQNQQRVAYIHPYIQQLMSGLISQG
jgi:hypothetical protein